MVVFKCNCRIESNCSKILYYTTIAFLPHLFSSLHSSGIEYILYSCCEGEGGGRTAKLLKTDVVDLYMLRGK